VTDLSFLIDELKQGLQLQYSPNKAAEMMVVFTQLEHDLKELDLVSPTQEEAIKYVNV
jgi:hypothetical protein